MSGESDTVKYYCTNCVRKVVCDIHTWVERVSTPEHSDRDTTRVRVEVSAKCPRCSRVLAKGDSIVELT